jgi:uncharacterized RDD family membrane protein YckC
VQPPALGPRVLARFLDAGIVGIPAGIVASLADISGGARLVFVAVVAVAYETIALGVHGRTIGKNICHLGVVDLDGRPLTWQQAFIRAAVLLVPAYLLSPKIDSVAEWLVLAFVLANYYVIAKRREDRRGIHDLAAGTRAIAVDVSLA